MKTKNLVKFIFHNGCQLWEMHRKNQKTRKHFIGPSLTEESCNSYRFSKKHSHSSIPNLSQNSHAKFHIIWTICRVFVSFWRFQFFAVFSYELPEKLSQFYVTIKFELSAGINFVVPTYQIVVLFFGNKKLLRFLSANNLFHIII